MLHNKYRMTKRPCQFYIVSCCIKITKTPWKFLIDNFRWLCRLLLFKVISFLFLVLPLFSFQLSVLSVMPICLLMCLLFCLPVCLSLYLSLCYGLFVLVMLSVLLLPTLVALGVGGMLHKFSLQCPCSHHNNTAYIQQISMFDALSQNKYLRF